MKIALDYDDTYTADPAFWDLFMMNAQAAGHDCRIVTARDDRFDRTDPLIALEERGYQVIFCRGIAKRFFTTHFTDFHPVQVWIDDKPQAVDSNSSMSPEHLVTWREQRAH